MNESLQYVILHNIDHLNQRMRCECASSARIRCRARENERKRKQRKRRKAEEKKNEEETDLRRISKQSILSDYVYEVEENTGKVTEYYAIRPKDITEVITYEHIRISEVDKENISHAVLYRTANANIRRAWESTRKFI